MATDSPQPPGPTEKPEEQSRRVQLWVKVLAVLLLGGVVEVILYGYLERPGWVGSSGKQFWDYLELLIVPAALAFGVYWLNRRQTERDQQAEEAQRERALAVERQRAQDEALQAYLNQMSQLLADTQRPLRRARPGDMLSMLARAQSLTTLQRLDRVRKRSVVQFLHETQLINKHAPVMLLNEANLKGANLSDTNLQEVSLSLANLREAELSDAFLSASDLKGAQLQGANLHRAHLGGADLSLFIRERVTASGLSTTFLRTDLSNADLSYADLHRANLKEAILREANLSEASLLHANLSKANLSEAKLRQARLRWANLTGANLVGADLSFADLSFADLSFAGLSGANLRNANLSSAHLRSAFATTKVNLSGANLSAANLSDVYLAEAEGITNEELEQRAASLEGATMPNGQKYEDWLKSRGEEGKNSGPS